MDSKKENLRELIEKFMDPKNTRIYLEDIEAGERILRQHPAPRPDDMLIANIKANIALHKLPQRTVTFRKRVYEAIAVAASLIIIATISLRSLYDTPQHHGPTDRGSLLQVGWWNNEDETHVQILNEVRDIYTQLEQIETTDDNYDALVLDEYKKQIIDLENRIIEFESSENNYAGTGILDEIENQINELGGSFWQDDYSNTDAFEI
ncbi:MAG: hypothetical protein JW787_17830 [Sedimentisphaerales bacterium]|nr:hypothetical protein [Sedimentisphaerales bacterium]